MTPKKPRGHNENLFDIENLQGGDLNNLINNVRNNFERLLIETNQFISGGFFEGTFDINWKQESLFYLLNFEIDFITLKQNIIFFRNNKERILRRLFGNIGYLDFETSVLEYLGFNIKNCNIKEFKENYFIRYFLDEFKLSAYKFIYDLKILGKINEVDAIEILYFLLGFEHADISDNFDKYMFQEHLIYFFHPDNLSLFEEKTGISIFGYPFKSIYHFISIIWDFDTPDVGTELSNVDHLNKFLHGDLNPKTNYPRIMSFLSISKPHLKGNETILELDNLLIEKFGEEKGIEIGNEIFEKYHKIIDVLNVGENEIKNRFFGNNTSIGFDRSFFDNTLIKNANKFLEKIIELLKTSSDKNAIFKEIENTKAVLSQYGSLFVSSEKEDIKSLEDIQKKLGVKLVEISGDKMNKKQKDEVRQLYESNYEDFNQKDDLLPYIVSSLEKDYKNDKAHFSMFYLQDICLLTYKFIEETDSRIYAGAFNAVDQMKFTKFGKFAFERKLVEFKDYEIHGHVIAGNDKLLEYYRQFGFEPDKNEDGTHKIEKLGKLDFIHIVVPVGGLKVDL
ncbi:MAG: hypothetical protein PHZ26_05480 [Candidatus Gracilibacteria bacterium]|nr:hypothetical protein [Candidatus Gracilibacteria bacterium]MDD2909167.1 hypothetical protein [Candidatus Gracilibacteria bacterium]